MNPKPKIVLSSNRYRFAHLLRHFTNAVAFAKAGEYLQPPDLFRTMDSLGYLSQEKCQKDYELVNSIIYLLAFPRGQGIVSQRNLFRFLMAVSDVHGNADVHFETQIQALPKDNPQLEDPLVKLQVGCFTEEGVWTPSQPDQMQVRKIFGQMVYTRVSRQDIEANRRREEQVEQEQFQPKILVKSTALAQSRFKKMGVEGKVEDRLLHGKNLYESRREEGLRDSIQRQLKECSFKPRTNSYRLNKENSFSLNKGQSLMLKGKEYQLRRKLHIAMQQQEKIKMDSSQCSFKPDLSLSRSSLRQSVRREIQPYVRNQDKAVSRVRVARQEREGLIEVNKRGYPAGISWVQFMQEVKRKRTCNETTSLLMENNIILSIDLKILGQKRHLQVREGDDMQEIADRICQQSNLSDSCYQKIFSMVVHSISQCSEIIIRSNHVYLKHQ